MLPLTVLQSVFCFSGQSLISQVQYIWQKQREAKIAIDDKLAVMFQMDGTGYWLTTIQVSSFIL